MLNFRVCGIAAGLAFAVSFIFGLISGNGFVVVLFRALLFGGVFFGLFALGFIVVSKFLPELLSESGDDFDISAPGSRVDISLGSSFEGAFPEDASESVDDIGGRPSAVKREADDSPLDQNENAGYTEKAGYSGDFADFGEPETLSPVEDIPGEAHSGEALPDMGGFSGGGGNISSEEQNIEVESFSSPEPPQRYSSSKKKPPIAENFDAKELAKAIQTALKKDEKG